MGLPEFVGLKHRLRARVIASQLSAPSNVHTNKVLVCTPATPGSLGDQAMLQACISTLTERGLTVDLLVENQNEDWSDLIGFSDIVAIKTDKNLDLEATMHILNNYDEMYVIGADILDGYHNEPTTIRLLWLAWLGDLVSKVTIVGFSFNDSPTHNSIVMLRRLPKSVRLFARDSISKERLASLARVNSELTADVAFLLDPTLHTEQSRPYLEWIEIQKNNDRHVVGINISGHSFEKVVESLEGRTEVIDHYKNELEMLLKDNVSLILMPHDIRGENGDLLMLQDLYKAFDPSLIKYITIMKPPMYASSIKQVAGSLDAALGGRMHLAIACLGMSTPVASIVYQGKFEGLYKHFPEMDAVTISPNRSLEPGMVVSIIKKLLADSKETRVYLNNRMPVIKKMADKNLQQS